MTGKQWKTRTRSISRRSRSWAICTTRWRPAATRGTNWNGSWSACCSACSPKTPASSSVMRSPTSWRIARRRTARTWAFTWRGLFEVLNTPPRRPAGQSGRTAGRFALRQRRAVRRTIGLCRVQPRHAERLARLHAVRLEPDFAGRLRLAVPGGHGAEGTAADRRALHVANATS